MRVFPTIDFDFVDDILNLEPEAYCRAIQKGKVREIAPIVEFVYHAYSTFDRQLRALPNSTATQHLKAAIRSGGLNHANNPISSNPKSLEFIPTPQNANEVSHPKWGSFLIRAQKAAEDSGIEKALSLIGTFEEMTDNIVWHSKLFGIRTPLKQESRAINLASVHLNM